MAMAKDFVFFGRLCLDFAHTGDMGYGSSFERLTTPEQLARWLSLSPLRLPPVAITGAELGRAKRLRRAIWRTASALLDNVTPSRQDVRLLNRAAARPGLVRELDPAAQVWRWRGPSAAAALASVAQDAVLLFGDPEQRRRMRRCGNSGCKALFFDDSRPGKRRWCASNRCGDRVRARTYRQRRKTRRG